MLEETLNDNKKIVFELDFYFNRRYVKIKDWIDEEEKDNYDYCRQLCLASLGGLDFMKDRLRTDAGEIFSELKMPVR